jgi:KaiC/GvpD/RAD55 family RecA-like ATPase
MQIDDKKRAILDSLVSPDDNSHRQYKHDYQISQKILGMLVSDKHFLIQSLDLIKPEYFEDQSHRLICSIVFDFFEKYKDKPNKTYISEEIRSRRANSKQLYQYLGEFEAIIADYVPGIETRDYLLDKITEFAKEQAVRVAVSKTIDMIQRKKEGVWNHIWELWRETLSTDKRYDLGLDYFNTVEDRYNRMIQANEAREVFTSGFSDIDKLLTAGGLCRGEIGAFVGLSGSGKSLALVNAAAKNLQWGKRVCYITLEMSQDKIAKRFDSMLCEQPFSLLLDNKNLIADALKDYVRDAEDKRMLVIKHWPGGTADINTFRAYLSQLSIHGFRPDLLVIDYVGELRDIPGVKTYESRQLLVRDMRTLGQEENLCVFTAMQANRKGREAQEVDGHIDDDALADAFGQARPMDAMWSLNKPESACPVGSIFVIKHRDGISRGEVYYEMDRNTLIMKQISQEEYKNALAIFRKVKANQVALKEMKVNKEEE